MRNTVVREENSVFGMFRSKEARILMAGLALTSALAWLKSEREPDISHLEGRENVTTLTDAETGRIRDAKAANEDEMVVARITAKGVNLEVVKRSHYEARIAPAGEEEFPSGAAGKGPVSAER